MNVSLLEQIAADKGRFSDESDHTLYGSANYANYVDYLRRLVPEKKNQLYDRQTNWLFFSTWFDWTSMVKTYDVKIL